MNWGLWVIALCRGAAANRGMNPDLSLMEPWKLPPSGVSRASSSWRDDRLPRLIPLLPGTTRLIVELSLQTGLTLAEVVALTLNDVDALGGRGRIGTGERRRWFRVSPLVRARLADQHRQVTWVYRGDWLAGWGVPSGRKGTSTGWLFPAQNPRVLPGGGRKLRVPVTEAFVRETIWRVSLLAGGIGRTGPGSSGRRARLPQEGRRSSGVHRVHRGGTIRPRGRPDLSGRAATNDSGMTAIPVGSVAQRDEPLK